jgi:hypothetical protein
MLRVLGQLLVLGVYAVFGACAEATVDARYFAERVYPVLEKAGCATCHNPDGVASATRLRFPESGASGEAIERFGRSLATLTDSRSADQSLLRTKPTLRVPHTGGKRIAPDSEEERVLARWVHHLVTISPEERSEAPPGNAKNPTAVARGSALRRLTHSQYNHTVRDLLGDESSPADQFPPEDFVNGFKGQFQAQSTGPLLEDAYSSAAERLARSAFRGGDSRGLVPCRPKSERDSVCAAAFVRRFGLKTFRRPLHDAEAARYTRLLLSAAAAEHDFYRGAQVVVEAMLQSPHFLYRVERGADPGMRGYERASALSYMFWDSMPDGDLLKSAGAGELDTPAGYERAARRLISDPRARRPVDQFVTEWMRFDRLLTAVKDRRLFPQFTPELALSMTEETRRLIADTVWNKRSFMRVFDADYAFLNSDLAAIYDLPAPSGEFSRVAFPPETDRAGIPGQGTFLALTSKPAETSPTARGLFVREQFLCQHVPDPPPGVDTTLPPVSEAKPMTNRERLATHLSNPSCASCHTLIDSIGFGLERFDAIGKRHQKMKVTVAGMAHDSRKASPKTFELELDSSAQIAGLPNSEFTSPKGLGKVLAASPQCQECVVKQLFRYQSGRLETPADRPALRRAFEDFKASGFQFTELMISLARWTEFPPGEQHAEAE